MWSCLCLICNARGLKKAWISQLNCWLNTSEFFIASRCCFWLKETHCHPKKLCCSVTNLPINKWLCDSRPPSYHRLPADCRVGLLAHSSFVTHLFHCSNFKMAHLNGATFFVLPHKSKVVSFHSLPFICVCTRVFSRLNDWGVLISLCR